MDLNSLLSFRTSTPSNLPSTSSPFPNSSTKFNANGVGNRNRQRNPKTRQSRQSQRREKQTREKLSSFFYLHSSPSHAFVITRIGSIGDKRINSTIDKLNSNKVYDANEYDPNAPIAWDKVRVVKSLITLDDNADQSSSSMTCAICLDSFTSPRITECGHAFCYACILQHFYSSISNQTQQTKTNFDVLTAKCPCCFHIIHRDQLKPVQFITVQSPKYQKGVKKIMSFRKMYIHRKSLVPFSPSYPKTHMHKFSHERHLGASNDDPRRIVKMTGNSGNCIPTVTEDDAPFCRFNFLDVPSYLQHLENDMSSLQRDLQELQSTMSCHSSNANANRQEQQHNGTYYLTMALQAVEVEHATGTADGVEELSLERDFLRMQKKYFVESIPYQQLKYQEGDGSTENDHDGSATIEKVNSGHPEEKIKNQSVQNITKQLHENSRRKMSVTEADRPESKTSKPSLTPGKTYLEKDSYHFYQSSDGQLCFISSFNINCLSTDYSANDPSLQPFSPSSTPQESHITYNDKPPTKINLPPFPDEIRGYIVDVEQVHLTPEIMKRMPFLSHLPLYTDVTFVEIDLNQLLSPKARNASREELERRKKKRQIKRNKERKESKAALLKEERRIKNLKRSTRNNTFQGYPAGIGSEGSDLLTYPHLVDFSTHDTGAPSLDEAYFGPDLPSLQMENTSPPCSAPAPVSQTPANDNPLLSFRSVCASNGIFPSLKDATIEQNSPRLGSKPGSLIKNNSWGRRTSQIGGSTFAKSNNEDHSTDSSPSARPNSKLKKKGSRGKQVLLFSNAGRRGCR